MPRNDIVDFFKWLAEQAGLFWEWAKEQPPHLLFLAFFVIVVVLSQIGGCCYRGEVLWWLP